MRRNGLAIAALTAVALAVAGAGTAAPNGVAASKHKLFMRSAKESKDFSTVTLPAYRGTSNGETVWFVVTDASSKTWANRYGANYVPKLANVANTGAVQRVAKWDNGPTGPDFPGTPNFAPAHVVVPLSGNDCSSGHRGPGILPAICFAPGAVASHGYSPLVQIDTADGIVVLDAPQIANGTGRGDKVKALRTGSGRKGQVDYLETAGLYDGHTIHYASFDSSDPLAAALEAATYVPALGRAPGAGHGNDRLGENLNTTTSARAGIIAFTNGRTGLGNRQRQGLNSAILDGASTPLNVIQSTPDDKDANGVIEYSPLWDVHLAAWANRAVARRDGDFVDIQKRSNEPGAASTDQGKLDHERGGSYSSAGQIRGVNPVTGKPSTFGATGFDVNCPIISTDGDNQIVVPKPT